MISLSLLIVQHISGCTFCPFIHETYTKNNEILQCIDIVYPPIHIDIQLQKNKNQYQLIEISTFFVSPPITIISKNTKLLNTIY